MRRLMATSLVLVGLVAAVVLWRDDALPRAIQHPVEEPAQAPAPVPEQPAAGTSSGPTTHSASGAGREPETEFPVPPADFGELRRLHGRVVRDDGEPVAGAGVWLCTSPFDGLTRFVVRNGGEVRSHARTNAAGEFQVDWVEGEFWVLTVSPEQGIPTIVRTPPPRDDITVVLPRRPTVLEVEVVRDGSGDPIADAHVEARWTGFPHHKAGETRSDGVARFPTAFEGTARITVTTGDGECIVDHSVDCRPSEVTRTRVEIGRGLTIRGTVVADDSGTPVADARVVLGLRFAPQLSRTTDAEGNFVWDRLPWDRNVRRTLSVVATGFAAWQGQIGHPDKDGAVQEIHVRLVRPATIRVHCVHPDGSPFPGVLVVAETERLVVADRVVAADMDAVHSDTEGQATLDRLAPGDSGKVTCWIKGAIAIEVPFARIAASEVRDLGNLVIRDPRNLIGTVLTASGKPATGASVVIEEHDDEDGNYAALSSALIASRFRARVGSDGRFRIRGVQPGNWDLLVYGGGHPRLLRVAIPIRSHAPLEELVLRLPLPVPLRGRVVDDEGAGVAECEVIYMRAHPVAPNLVESVTTDAEGRFEIPGFTREDEDVPIFVGETQRKVTPRDGPVEIRIAK